MKGTAHPGSAPSMARSSSEGYLAEIDGLRALSVLSIVLFHFGVESMSGGYIGVDIFFVISGFLITRNILQEIQKNTFSFSGFYYRRVRRLIPAFIATLFVSVLIAGLLMSPAHFERTAKAAVFAIFSASNFFFWSEAGYFDVSSAIKPLLHFWSLAVEEQFYLLWPAFLVLLMHSRLQRRYVLLLVLITLVSLAASEFMLTEHASTAFYLVPFRVYEFSLGALCLNFRQYNSSQSTRTIGSLAGLVLILWSLISYEESTRFPGLNALLPCIGACLLLTYARSGPVAQLLRNRYLVFIGVLSYSLYLVHWPLVTFYTYWTSRPLEIYETLGLIVVALLLAYVLHKQVEVRYRLSRSQAAGLGGRQFFFGLGTVSALLLVLSVLVVKTDGISQRVARNDLMSTQDKQLGQCQDLQKLSEHEQTCRLGSTASTKQMLVLGDSHAGHLKVALDYLGRKGGFSVQLWTHSGCPPLSGTYKIFGGDGSTKQSSCKQQVPKWEAAIIAGGYDYIALAARWMRLFEPDAYGGKTIRRDFLVAANNPQENLEASRSLFVSSLNLTVSQILDAGARPVIFSQVPLLANNVQDCNQVPHWLYSRKRLAHRCEAGVSYTQMMDRLTFSNETIRSLQSTDVSSVILSDALCNPATRHCNTLLNGALLYQDDNHLTSNGSYYIATQIEKALLASMSAARNNP